MDRDDSLDGIYYKGFSIVSLMATNSVGLVTGKDSFTLDIDTKNLNERIDDLKLLSGIELSQKYKLGKWSYNSAKLDILDSNPPAKLTSILYRPFDQRWTYYTGNSSGFHARPRPTVMDNFLDKDNIGILISRSATGQSRWQEVQCSDRICEFGIMSTRPGNGTPLFPLYLYPEEDTLDQNIRLNFDPKIYNQIRKAAGLSDAPFKGDNDGFRTAIGDARPDEIKVFDYIYGVLHCPAYRETYKEFLKIDFPRIPYPSSPDSFADISEKGEALRRLHLMEDSAIGNKPYPFDGEAPEDMDSIVEKPRYDDGKVYINGKSGDGQYFADVPELAWDFYIGGYQPAQKWLKDRKGRVLSYDDIRHYQKIIKILSETHRIMETIVLPTESDGEN